MQPIPQCTRCGYATAPVFPRCWCCGRPLYRCPRAKRAARRRPLRLAIRITWPRPRTHAKEDLADVLAAW